MPFGMTYAMYVGVVLTALALPPNWCDMDGKNTLGVTAGANNHDKHSQGKGNDGVFSIEYRPKPELLYGLKSLYAVGVTVDAAGYASMGVRKDFHLGWIRLEPYFGPALYQRSIGNFRAAELTQFRTGIDVFGGGEDLAFGVGFYHISNANITSESARFDVIHAAVKMKF
jgi:hypothetical protein